MRHSHKISDFACLNTPIEAAFWAITLPTTYEFNMSLKEKKTSDSTRLALVIGNSNYEEFPKLYNPRKDAEDVTTMLRSLGFVVGDPCLDRSRYDIMKDTASFVRRIQEDVSDILLYYSGHGCSIGEF